MSVTVLPSSDPDRDLYVLRSGENALSMLAELVEVVIGVDTHKHTHTAAVLAASTGAVLATATVAADPDGYAELVELAEQHSGVRAWAIEGTGGYGAGLARTSPGHRNWSSSWIGPPARRARPGRSPTRSTPCARLGTHWRAPRWPSPAVVPKGALCRSC